MDAAFYNFYFSKIPTLIIACYLASLIRYRHLKLFTITLLNHILRQKSSIRHSSPKSFGRGTNSPKIQEYRPNIHDLKQLFDENSHRPSIAPCKSSKSYGDARPSQISHDEIIFEGKSRTDFERVKQKFDNRHSNKTHIGSSSGKHCAQKYDRFSSSSSQKLPRCSEMNFNECKAKMNNFENHNFGIDPLPNQNSLEKEENICNFNLDGFKISEDDDDDDVSSSNISC